MSSNPASSQTLNACSSTGISLQGRRVRSAMGRAPYVWATSQKTHPGYCSPSYKQPSNQNIVEVDPAWQVSEVMTDQRTSKPGPQKTGCDTSPFSSSSDRLLRSYFNCYKGWATSFPLTVLPAMCHRLVTRSVLLVTFAFVTGSITSSLFTTWLSPLSSISGLHEVKMGPGVADHTTLLSALAGRAPHCLGCVQDTIISFYMY